MPPTNLLTFVPPNPNFWLRHCIHQCDVEKLGLLYPVKGLLEHRCSLQILEALEKLVTRPEPPTYKNGVT
jgi:hypothetical protein